MVEPEQPQRHDKVTLETVIPALPSKEQKVRRPDQDAFELQLREFDRDIGALKTQFAGLQQILGPRRDADLTASKTRADQLQAQKDLWHEEKNRIKEEYTAAETEIESLKEEQSRTKGKLRFFSEEEVNRRITDLQTKQEHTSLSLNEEKRLISELRDLEMSRPLLTQFIAKAQVLNSKKADQTQRNAQIRSLWDQINAASKSIEEEKRKLREAAERRSAEIPSLRSQKEDIRREVEALENRRRTLIRDHDLHWKTFRDQQKLIKFVEFATRLQKMMRECEERRKSTEERKERKEDREDSAEKERNLCDNAILCLNRQLPRICEEVKTSEQSEVIAVDGQQVFVDRRQPTAQDRQRRSQVKKKDKLVNLSMEIVVFLTDAKIKVPGKVSEIPATIEALKRKREECDHLQTPKTCPSDGTEKEEILECVESDQVLKSNSSDAILESENLQSPSPTEDTPPIPSPQVCGNRSQRLGRKKPGHQ